MREKRPEKSFFMVNPDTDDCELDSELMALSGVLTGLPQHDPPPELLTGVMSRIRPKKVSWARKLALWFKSPRNITWTPWRVMPWGVAAASLLIAFLTLQPKSGLMNGMQASVSNPNSDIKIVLSLNLDGASSAAVIGDFNSWSPKGFEMRWDEGSKQWVLPLKLKNGRYEYAFLVDGKQVLPDPAALFSRDDGFGSKNSILIVRNGGGNENI